MPKIVRNMAVGVKLVSLGYGSFELGPLINMFMRAIPPVARKMTIATMVICNTVCGGNMFKPFP